MSDVPKRVLDLISGRRCLESLGVDASMSARQDLIDSLSAAEMDWVRAVAAGDAEPTDAAIRANAVSMLGFDRKNPEASSDVLERLLDGEDLQLALRALRAGMRQAGDRFPQKLQALVWRGNLTLSLAAARHLISANHDVPTPALQSLKHRIEQSSQGRARASLAAVQALIARCPQANRQA
jgi:hypothetical protein